MTSHHELPRGQIFVIDNVLNSDECQEIINVIDKHAVLKECYGESANVQSTYIDLEMLKNSHKELHDRIHNMIFNSINRTVLTVGRYPVDISCIKSDSGYRLRKIHGPTKIHVDGVLEESCSKVRFASVIIALNSDYEGGEFVFQEQDVKIKLKAGQALFFPPYWSHPHETLELHGTYRYTINTWLCH